jgi:hypothetical protein
MPVTDTFREQEFRTTCGRLVTVHRHNSPTAGIVVIDVFVDGCLAGTSNGAGYATYVMSRNPICRPRDRKRVLTGSYDHGSVAMIRAIVIEYLASP